MAALSKVKVASGGPLAHLIQHTNWAHLGNYPQITHCGVPSVGILRVDLPFSLFAIAYAMFSGS